MSLKKYIDAGFDVNELFIAGFHAGYADTMSALNEMSETSEIAKLVTNPKNLPSQNLENALLGPIEKPMEGINYVIEERESWFSTLSLYFDIILLNEHLSKLNDVRNSTPDVQEALLRRSELFITLRSHNNHVLSGFYLLYAHKPLMNAIVEAFYEDVFESDESLSDDAIRMSPETFLKIAKHKSVKHELRRFCEAFRNHQRSLWDAIKRAEEFLGVSQAETELSNEETQAEAV